MVFNLTALRLEYIAEQSIYKWSPINANGKVECRLHGPISYHLLVVYNPATPKVTARQRVSTFKCKANHIPERSKISYNTCNLAGGASTFIFAKKTKFSL